MSYQKSIFYSLLFLITGDALTLVGNSGYTNNFLISLVLVVKYVALFIFIYIAKKSNWSSDLPKIIPILFKVGLVWNIFTIIRGIYFAGDYWDWKFLMGYSILFFLIPLTFFIGRNISFARMVIRYVLKILFLYGFLLIPIAFATNRELYSRLMIPVSIFILFIPYLKGKWRRLILVIAFVSIAVVIDYRTNIIKICISMGLLAIYYLRSYVFLSWIKILHVLFFATPIILFSLAVSGQYNIFAEAGKKSYNVKSVKGGPGEDENLTADTRTLLYVEVLNSLNNSGNMLIGEGASGKYQSNYFDTFGDNRGRYSSEVGFLNLLLYSGVIGVIIYFLILFMSSYYAIYHSQNFLCKLLGLLIAGRWLLFFIEEFTNFDLNTLFTWMIIGLISNRSFRALSDADLKVYFRV